eukprot:GEMP01081805.1.p2 GENE.GEMP01081805.1~~GEMP01081805.1.p2  ORF type:complete len:123 (+),score=2.37 GEMP01081805.1:462-830(+)
MDLCVCDLRSLTVRDRTGMYPFFFVCVCNRIDMSTMVDMGCTIAKQIVLNRSKEQKKKTKIYIYGRYIEIRIPHIFFDFCSRAFLPPCEHKQKHIVSFAQKITTKMECVSVCLFFFFVFFLL